MSPGHGDLARVGLGVGNGSGTDVLNLNHDINMTITNLSLHCLATFCIQYQGNGELQF